jgi:probable rRNA maturation factor
MIIVEPRSRGAAAGKLRGGPKVGKFSRTELARFLVRARRAAGLAGRVEVLLAGDETLARLNRDYRKKSVATDVLSFPALVVPGHAARVAGDLAISIDTAARQAEAQGHALEDELKILILHGVLHLAGHDHERDDGEMRRLEQRLRRTLGLPAGLIERAAKQRRGRRA